MANVFSDIFEAIRIIRQKKGTKETDIMTFVHDRLGKRVSIRTVLKTMKTLNRLVEDGLLVKKGCRYMLPLPFDKGAEEKKEEEDDCMDDDDDDDDDGMEDDDDDAEDDDDDDDDCMDDEDDAEDDDDDEEEEEDDDDDDDDDDCMKDDEDEKNDNGNDDGARKCNFDDEMKGMRGKDNGHGNKREDKDPCKMEKDAVDFRGRRNEDADLSNKHIDSKMKKYMKSELNPVAGSFVRSKKQRHVSRRNQVYDEEYDELSHTGSPMRKSSDDIDLIMDVEEGLHESAGGAQFINSDLSFGYEERDSLEGFIEYRYKNSNGPQPPNTPGVHVDRRESCSKTVLKVNDPSEAQQGDKKSKEHEDGDKKQDRQPYRRAGDESKEKILKQDDSKDKLREDKRSSICKLCNKKKPPEHVVDLPRC